MDPITQRVVRRFKLAGVVLHLPHQPNVPTLAINGRKYRLSDYWPMMGSVEEMADSDGGEGARLIDLGGNRFRYLWVYDTDKGRLTMWRHSDGDEKYSDRSVMQYIYSLEKRGQLNRISHAEFVEVERFMARRNDEMSKRLKELAAEQATDWDHRVADILQNWFDRNIRPSLDRRLAELESGVTPIGYRTNDRIIEHRDPAQQVRQFVVTKALEGFSQTVAYDVVSKEVGFDAYEPPNGDSQAVQWAYGDLLDKIYDEYLPFRA